ncbi:MAG TPA: imidazole glycerol phosphate synthase subunit HisH [Longimicrobiales bacterium]|nr:imidazole glycerol phosphate synthase subunit HisH [Longimicrobiales bacterium]
MNVLLFDYGTGNLHSLRKALELQGARVHIGAELDGADAVILPGVGAFGAAAARLASRADALRRAASDGLPVLGICLGMQLLLDGSDEGTGAGLGLVPGRVTRLRARRVPHMGWNTVDARPAEPLFDGIDGRRFYFANSFAAEPRDDDDVAARVEHEGASFPAALRRGAVAGTQFHPEKSGEAGLRLLRNFLASAR